MRSLGHKACPQTKIQEPWGELLMDIEPAFYTLGVDALVMAMSAILKYDGPLHELQETLQSAIGARTLPANNPF